MKKLVLSFAAAALLLTACGGDAEGGDEAATDYDSYEAVAAEYCEMVERYEAAEGEEKEKISEEMNDYENMIEEKHEGDEEWFNNLEDEIERICEAG